MKLVICLTFCALIAGCFCQDAQDDLQQFVNGFWEQGGLSDPTTVLNCFDEDSANLTVTFIGDILSDLASSNVQAAMNDLQTFDNNLPAYARTCLDSNAEMQQVFEAYNIYGLTPAQLETKIETYALFHLTALHQDAIVANSDFQAANYKMVGVELGTIIQTVFGKNISTFTEFFQVEGTALNALQLMANGFFEQGGLPDPSTVINCFDEDSANLTVTFVGNILQYVVSNNIKKAEDAASAFEKALPQSVQQCVADNAEMQEALKAYNMAGLTIKQVETKAESYALLHFLQLHHDTIIANSDFQAGNFKAVGQEGGSIVQNIFGKSESLIN